MFASRLQDDNYVPRRSFAPMFQAATNHPKSKTYTILLISLMKLSKIQHDCKENLHKIMLNIGTF